MENPDFIQPQRQFKSMTVGDWLITFIIQSIPIIGFIMLFVWAFGDNTHPSKKTWAQATLLFLLIAVGSAVLFFFLLGGFLFSIFSQFDYNYST